MNPERKLRHTRGRNDNTAGHQARAQYPGVLMPEGSAAGRCRISLTEVPGSPRSIMLILDAGFRVTSTPSTCSSISPAMVNIIRWREDRQSWRCG